MALELIKRGADINFQDRDFLTPLHIACLNNHVETVEMLIGLGANTKAKDRYGRTPLQFLSAAEAQNEDDPSSALQPLLSTNSGGGTEV